MCSQLRPVSVSADAGIDGVDELLEAVGVRVLVSDKRLRVIVEKFLDGAGAHGVLGWAK
ncbi:hypothetical protein OIO89_00810 (plasmid) [Mycobacterium ulcerans]|nr:hypothetical protein [Mycobacterium marinum]UZK92674.1 hypothetical protein OIO89_00810 [Mycobacterium ulcerans]